MSSVDRILLDFIFYNSLPCLQAKPILLIIEIEHEQYALLRILYLRINGLLKWQTPYD